jgi:hypothetical protein
MTSFWRGYIALLITVFALSVATVSVLAGIYPAEHWAPQFASWLSAYAMIFAAGVPLLHHWWPVTVAAWRTRFAVELVVTVAVGGLISLLIEFAT